MAGMFYSLQEAAEKLNISEDQLKELAQEGRLREFRDGPNILFKVDEVEALMPDHLPDAVHGEFEAAEFETPELEVTEPETPEPEMAEPEPQAEEEEPIELDLSDTEVPQEETPEPEMTEPEPESAEEEEEIKLDLSDTEKAEPETSKPEAEIPEPEAPEEVPDVEALEEEMAGLEEPADEVLEEELMPEAYEEAEAPEPEVPQPSESAADSDEILLAPETGAPLTSSDLTDADTALTGLGTNVLGETDQDYAITDDTMAETAIPTSPTGTTPEVPLEEIEGDVNLDTFGSGSGLLDLSLQADDTSLGGILDEIYTTEEEGKELGEAEGDSAAAMVAEADQMVVPEEELAAPQVAPEMGAIAGPMIEVAPDTQSNTLGMLLFLPLVIVIYTLVVAVAGQREVMPSILASIQAFIWYIMGGAAVVAGIVIAAALLFTGERGTAAPKEKKAEKVKIKKEKKPKEKKVKEPKKAKKAKKGFLRLK